MDIAVKFILLVPWICTKMFSCTHGLPSSHHYRHASSFIRPDPRVLVNRGRSVYLNPVDIFESSKQLAGGNTSCRMQVKQDEPLSLRVGELSPRIFDCNFPPATVKYNHNGFPLLEEDSVVFQLYLFGKSKTEFHTLKLTFEIVEASYDIIVQDDDTLQMLEVSHENWLSVPIDTSILKFKYSFNHGTYCSISYTEYNSQWPLVGHIVGGLEKDYIQEFVEDCNDFLYKGYHYEYLGGMSPQMDYIPLKVKFHSGINGDDDTETIEENLYLPIQIMRTKPNSPPNVSNNKTVTIEVEEYKMEIIDNGLLQAWDEETASEYIIYNITYPAPPSLQETGYFVNINDPLSAITSFYQRDLTVGMIGYYPRVRSKSNRRKGVIIYESLTFAFTAFDTHFESSQPLDINIVIKIDENIHEPVVIPHSLVVNEGERTRLSADYFIFPYDLKLDQTQFQFKGGLKHGKLEINGTNKDKFSYIDLMNGDVEYVHDGSESPDDRIALKITDGNYNFKKRYPVTVLQRPDSAPFVVNNKGIEVKSGQFVEIKKSILNARDRDSTDNEIVYKVKMPPLFGEIRKVYHQTSPGIPISQFTQYDINMGYIFYHHFGKSSSGKSKKEQTDSFEFILTDRSLTPNKSGKNTVDITILPNDLEEPKWVTSSTRQLITKETDIAYITKDLLQYSSAKMGDQISYTIIKQPFFQTSTITVDAGRLVAAKNISDLKDKDSNIPALWSFTQEEVNTWQIAYMPPIRDIGPIRRYAELEYSVTDLDGNCAMAQRFEVVILPVNNQLPFISIHNIEITEGGVIILTTDHITAYDSDTDQKDLLFTLKEGPKFGQIIKEDYRMVAGEEFHVNDIANGNIRYEHDGSEFPEESIVVSVSDGINIVSEEIPITVEILSIESDEKPSNDEAVVIESLDKGDDNSQNLEPDLPVMNEPDFDNPRARDERPMSDLQVNLNRPDFSYHRVGDSNKKSEHHKSSNKKLKALSPDSEITIGGEGINGGIIKGIVKGRVHQVNSDDTDVDNNTNIPVSVEDLTEKYHDSTEEITVGDTLHTEAMVPALNSNKKDVVDNTDIDEEYTNTEYIYDYDENQDEEWVVVKLDHTKQKEMMDLNTDFLVTVKDQVQTKFSLSLSNNEMFILSFYQDKRYNITHNALFSYKNPRVLFDTALVVAEGGESAITLDNLAIPSNNTIYQQSRCVLLSPEFGDIVIGNEIVTEFKIEDVKQGKVKYIHSSGEIGLEEKYDIITLSMIDNSMSSIFNAPLVDMNVTITPIDNQIPSVVLGGPIFVQEGETIGLDFEMLSAEDIDTEVTKLEFIISEQPMYGYIENMNLKANLGSITTEKVNQFSYKDLKMKEINYVQSNHSGYEPAADYFEVYVNDGVHNSQPVKLRINIIPVNDEMPHFDVGELMVDEGGKTVLPPDFIHASDADRPKQRLVVSLAEKPKHGELVVMLPSSSGNGDGFELPMYDATISDIQQGKIMIVYKHDSSENFNDQFTLKLTDGIHVTRRIARVKVVPHNDEHPTIIRNTVFSVDFGKTAFLTKEVLQTTDEDNTPEEIMYFVFSTPKKGMLQHRVDTTVAFTASFLSYFTSSEQEGRGWQEIRQGDNFTQADIDNKDIRYIHTGTSRDLNKENNHHGHSHNVGNFDAFVFEVQDGMNSIPPVTFDIEIIQSDNINIALLTRGIRVKEGDTQVLTSNELSASDGESLPKELVYTVTHAPTFGKLGLLTDKNKVIYSFTQADLDSQKVMYTHISKVDVHEDIFKFTLVNRRNQSRNGIFKILIEPVDRILPMLVKNTPLTVVQDEAVTLTAFNLQIYDPDTPPSNLTYLIVELPQYGNLLNNGAVVSEFTQYDIDKGLVKYKNAGSNEAGVDYFLFTIGDGHNSGFTINGTFEKKSAFFNILVQPPEKKPPRMVNVLPPSELESLGNGKFGFIFTSENLKAIHPKSESRDVVYAIIDKPRHGYLQNLREFRAIKKKFTQKDVDEGNVAFILEDDTEATNDSFVFRVYDDATQNGLDDQSYPMSWSVVEFDQTYHTVCEDAEMLLIVLKRNGSVNGTTIAEVKVKGMSAKEGVDFKVLSPRMVTFNPGMKHAAIEIKILNDGVPEGNEKFRVKLRRSKNAVIGMKEKTIVQIVNLDIKGKCDDYIGMISRDQRDPLGLGYADLFPEIYYLTPAADTTTIEQAITTTAEPFDIFDFGRQFYDEGSSKKGVEYELPTAFPIAVEVESINTLGNNVKGKDTNDLYIKKKHPLTKYKTEKKGRRGKKRRKEKRNETTNLGFTPLPDPAGSTIAPQSCSRETKGLLYFDLMSSKIFKCDGISWQRWDWGPGYLSSMFRDAPQNRNSDGEISSNRGDDISAFEDYSKTVTEQEIMEDGCPIDWQRYRDYCYYMSDDRTTWENAEKQCMKRGGSHLSSVSSDKHMTWLWKLAVKHKFWIGLSSHGESDWRYTSGAAVNYFNWKTGYPRSGRNRRYTGKECALVIGKAWWVNRPCNRSRANYICSQPAEESSRNNEDNFPSWYSL